MPAVSCNLVSSEIVHNHNINFVFMPSFLVKVIPINFYEIAQSIIFTQRCPERGSTYHCIYGIVMYNVHYKVHIIQKTDVPRSK